MVIIDGTDMILGRMASVVAKKLLAGEEIIIVNAEKTIVVGLKKNIIANYKFKRALSHPRKGPYYPRLPDRIVKRTIRGMLPYKKHHGKEALKRLKVYIGIPDEYRDKKLIKIDEASKPSMSYVTIGEISRMLGGLK